jgi:hypothetical protein
MTWWRRREPPRSRSFRITASPATGASPSGRARSGSRERSVLGYLNSGALALSLDHWRDLLARWRKACERLRVGQIGRDPAGPFWAADQDALNALLMSEVSPEAQVVGAERQSLHPDALREVVVRDEERLSCSYRGATPAFLHFSLVPKAIEAARDGNLGPLRRLATSVAAVASPRRAR